MRIAFLLLLGSLFSPAIYAHLRWFVDEHQQIVNARHQFDMLYGLVLTGTLCFCLLCCLMHKQAQLDNSRIHLWLNKPLPICQKTIWQIAAGLLALMMLFNTLDGVAIAPNLNFDPVTLKIMLMLQLCICLALLLNPRLAGFLLVALILLLTVHQPWDLAMDYAVEFIAITFALLVRASISTNRLNTDQTCHMAATMLRIGLGAQLIILGVHNKLLDPGLGLAFLHYHEFINFMPYLGMTAFSNLHFVFAAGTVETALGALLLLGITTRLIALTVTFFFALTTVLFGAHELVGHLPVFAITLILVCHPPTRNAPFSPQLVYIVR